VAFDGPGQQPAWFEHGIPFRPDWEAVLTPVLDAMPWVGSCAEAPDALTPSCRIDP
jgi:hypothetical protein